MVISTSPANRYISVFDCTFCKTMIDHNAKFIDSLRSARRRRSCKHCSLRHRSRIVCPERRRKKRKKESCPNLRVSKEIVNNQWNFCDINDNDIFKHKSNSNVFVNGTELKERIIDSTEKNIKSLSQQCGETNNECCDTGRIEATIKERKKREKENEEKKSVEEKIASTVCKKKTDLITNIHTQETASFKLFDSCEKICFDNSEFLSSFLHGEDTFTDIRKDLQISQNVTDSCILKDSYKTEETCSPSQTNEQQENRLYKVKTVFFDDKICQDSDYSTPTSNCSSIIIEKNSQSDYSTSNSDNIDNSIDSSLYRELQKNHRSFGQKRTRSRGNVNFDLKSQDKRKNIKSRREIGFRDKILKGCSCNLEAFSSNQKQRKSSIFKSCDNSITNDRNVTNKYQSMSKLQRRYFCRPVKFEKTPREKSYLDTLQQNTINQKNPNYLCEDCCSTTRSKTRSKYKVSWDGRIRSSNNFQCGTTEVTSTRLPLSSQQPQFNSIIANVQFHRNNDSFDDSLSEKSTDVRTDCQISSEGEEHLPRYKSARTRYKEEPISMIHRKDTEYMNNISNVTSSACSSPSSIVQHPHRRSHRPRVSNCKRTLQIRCKCNHYERRSNLSSQTSLSSSLSSSKRSPCNFRRNKQRSSSSSSCTNVSTKKFRENCKSNIDRTISPLPFVSSSSLMSASMCYRTENESDENICGSSENYTSDDVSVFDKTNAKY